MVQLRRILCLVLCCSVCLIGCVVPASAAKLDTIGGVVISEQDTFAITYQPWGGSGSTVYPFNSVPASFEFADGNYIYRWESDLPYDQAYDRISKGGKIFEVMINVSDRTGPVDVSFDSFSALPLATNAVDSAWKMNGTCELLIDNEAVWSTTVSNADMPVAPGWAGSVEGYFSIRYTFTSDCKSGVYYAGYEPQLLVSIPNLTVENQVTVLDEILISVKNIEGDISDIKSSVTNIEEGMVELNTTVTDMSAQLQDSNSNIWQAAGSTISGAIESLFVPSEQDIAAVKDGFDQLAQDKLGGAYTAMETVDSTLEQVNDKLNNPSAAEGVEFPGISVPLGGEVGTVTLLEAQMVTMPVQLTTILHPIAGTIVSIVCGLGTFNVLKDMVECFLSGFSYSEFLHRNKGGSDE